MPKKRAYIDVNVPREWEAFFDEALKDSRIGKEIEVKGFSKTHSGLGVWIIHEFLVENTSFRFQHLNTSDSHITIIDNKIRHIVDVYVREGRLWCEYDDSFDCDHTKFALRLAEVQKALKKKDVKIEEKEGE